MLERRQAWMQPGRSLFIESMVMCFSAASETETDRRCFPCSSRFLQLVQKENLATGAAPIDSVLYLVQ